MVLTEEEMARRGFDLQEDGESLVLKKVDGTHEGRYTCIASNTAGSAKETFSVQVLCEFESGSASCDGFVVQMAWSNGTQRLFLFGFIIKLCINLSSFCVYLFYICLLVSESLASG